MIRVWRAATIASIVNILAAVTGGVLLPTPVIAQAYSATWIIDPVPPRMEEITIKPGDVITEARLLPSNLLVLDGDAVRVDGKPAAPRGTQMMQLRSSMRSACTFSFPVSLFQQFLFGAQNFTCFVDEDADGKFESVFSLSSSKIGIPPPFGKIPKNRISIAPVAYSSLPLVEGKELPRLLFKYSHRDRITGHSYLGICIANSTTNKQPCFDGYIGIRKDKIPNEVGMAGNLIAVTGKDSELITLTVRHGFKRMPFVGEERTVWTFY